MIEEIGKYKVIRELGKGATSAVYLAKDPFKDNLVAIKLVKSGDESKLSRRYQKLFIAESALAGKLHHPHIVAIYDAVIEKNQSYMVMEYVDGETLEKYCKLDKLMAYQRTVQIIFKCCLALDYAFREGVIHRDIKPANIMLAKGDEVRISDFGLALNVGYRESDSTQISGVGSPAYMSPEQVKGHPLNQQTDLYSLGVVLYQLLTGRLPYRAKNSAGLIYKIINQDPLPPSTIRPDVPKQLDLIVMKALAKDLYNRYRSGGEFGQDLSNVIFQIKDDEVERIKQDSEKFGILRDLDFFRFFEDIDLWEVLRITNWEVLMPDEVLINEDEEATWFGVLAKGQVKVTKGGREITTLGSGQCIGEMAYLNTAEQVRSATVISMTEATLIKVNNAALAISSEECQACFNKAFLQILVERLAETNRMLIASS
jgi:eukaryotic-like serine/threonine-protein kinase